MILTLYRLLTRLAGPIIAIYLLKRKRAGKEDSARFKERFGYASLQRPNGQLVWIHAASVGEALSVIPLINKLAGLNNDINFLLTTGTTSSAKMVENRLAKNAFHQYVPIDTIGAVNRFLAHWQPNLALWVESEFWPNLVTKGAKSCPVILINARISDSSYVKWQRYSSLGKQILGCFSLCLAQSKQDADRLVVLGAANVKYEGNIKYDSPPLPFDLLAMDNMVKMIGKRTIWMAASTHPWEEKIIAQIHKNLKNQHPDLLTIIAPRHPKRAEEILNDIAPLGLNIAMRSKDEAITKDTDIYLADTLGELGLFYRLSPVVFIGGSLVPRGGQNPLEAARLDCSIIFGPYMYNFTEIKAEFLDKNAAIVISDNESLQNAVEEFISDSDKQQKLASAAMDVVKEKSGILDAFVREITPYLKK
jgi:3-deoxy-D-manno-octulosonic-acid transferase